MDRIDMALLELLEEDARRTPEQVGVLLGITAAEAKARIEGLEASGGRLRSPAERPVGARRIGAEGTRRRIFLSPFCTKVLKS